MNQAMYPGMDGTVPNVPVPGGVGRGVAYGRGRALAPGPRGGRGVGGYVGRGRGRGVGIYGGEVNGSSSPLLPIWQYADG
jgi:hypothetical protein